MAKIPKTGIANASTIQASHITNIIDALDGTGTYDIDATGSFTGSFSGDGSNITGVTGEWDGSHLGNASITGSLIISASSANSNTLQVGANGYAHFEVGSAVDKSTVMHIYARPFDDPDLYQIAYSSNTLTECELFLGAGKVEIGDIEGSSGNSTTLTINADPNLGDVGFRFTNHPLTALGSITASADISSSGTVRALNVNAATSLQVDGNRISYNATDLEVVDTGLKINGNVTASGDISSSGTIIANKIESSNLVSHLGDANTGIAFGNDTVVIEANDINMALFSTSGQTVGNASYTTTILGSSLTVTPPITASGDVSSSAASTASFGTYLGDGSQLSGITSGYWTGSGAIVSIEQAVEVSASMTFVESRGINASYAFGDIAADPTALIETRAVKTHTTLEPTTAANTSLSESGAYGGSIVVYDGGNQTGNMSYSLPTAPTLGTKYTIVCNGNNSSNSVTFRSNSANIHGFISSPDNTVQGVFTSGTAISSVEFPATRFTEGDWISFTRIRTGAGGGENWAMDGCAFKASTILLS